jgi:hypothetical protein
VIGRIGDRRSICTRTFPGPFRAGPRRGMGDSDS